jgi:DNA-binding MarR family transcriptional regulator
VQRAKRTGRPSDPALTVDAIGFSAALEDLARTYQLQDPRQTCTYGITLTECYALEAVVENGTLTVNEVAAELALDKSTASRAVASLVRKGLIARRGHPRDRRSIEVSPTAPGSRLYRRIRDAGRKRHRDLLQGFPPEARRAAIDLLSRLAVAERSRTRSGSRASTPA